MLNLGTEINRAIDIAKERSEFKQLGLWRSETYNQSRLNNELQSANLTFLSSVAGMNSLSHQIEDQFATRRDDFHLYSAFQKISRLWPQKERYRRILRAKRPVYVFGLPDAHGWNDPNLHFVYLEQPAFEPLVPGAIIEGNHQSELPHTTDLTQNWFVIGHSQHYVSMALLARENQIGSANFNSNKLLKRSFEGMWTTDLSLITELSNVIEQYLSEKKSSHLRANAAN